MSTCRVAHDHCCMSSRKRLSHEAFVYFVVPSRQGRNAPFSGLSSICSSFIRGRAKNASLARTAVHLRRHDNTMTRPRRTSAASEDSADMSRDQVRAPRLHEPRPKLTRCPRSWGACTTISPRLYCSAPAERESESSFYCANATADADA